MADNNTKLQHWLKGKNLSPKALDQLATKLTGISMKKGTKSQRLNSIEVSKAFKTTTTKGTTTNYDKFRTDWTQG